MNDKIKELQNQIESEKRKMSNCKHMFGETFSNPETTREAYGYKMIANGSDVYYEPKGYHDVTVARWTHICVSCGFEEHTKKQKPESTKQIPDFS